MKAARGNNARRPYPPAMPIAASTQTEHDAPGFLARPVPQAVVLLLVCIAVYFTGLGVPGLFDSEAQRVLPGWSMARGTDTFVPELFERPYARKPPGMPWAVAATARLFGETEFAARSVSALAATGLAFLSFHFARRWLAHLSPRAGLMAGVAQACLPLMISPATAAEIEMLHNLWVGLAALCVLDLALASAPSRGSRSLAALGIALGVSGMIITKGPAGVPVVAAAISVAIVMRRLATAQLHDRAMPLVFAALVGGVCLALAVLLEMKRRIALLPPDFVVLQDPREFLWNLSRFGGILTLPLVALLSALPLSLVVPMALVPRWRDTLWQGLPAPCRAIVWTVLLSLAIFTLVGVSNPRYAMPTMGFLGPVAAAAMLAFVSTSRDTFIARQNVSLGLRAMVAAAIAIHAVQTWQRIDNSGKAAGQSLAAALLAATPGDNITLWADGVIETRAEVPHYLAAEAHTSGRRVDVRWWPILTRQPPARAGDFYLLRHDAEMDEVAALSSAADPLAGDATLKKWRFALAPISLGNPAQSTTSENSLLAFEK